MAGGKVFLFRDGAVPPPQRNKYWRTPDEIVDIGADGKFKACLVAGRYYIAALKRSTKDLIGPPEEGDVIYPGSRMELKKEQQSYLVKKDEVTDTGILSEAVAYQKSPSTAGITALEGTVLASDGKPLAGAVVFAYLASDMIGKPLFVSERTHNDGKYLLRVSEKGSYYLKARTSLSGGKPNEGEIIGVFGEGIPAPVAVNTGEIVKGITITGKKFVSQYRGRFEDE